MGRPEEFVQTEYNHDNESRTLFHAIAYKGNAQTLATLLNYDRECLKKHIFEELVKAKQLAKLKSSDVFHGELNSATFHDADTVKRHQDFNIRATGLFERYSNTIVERTREIICSKDRLGRNSLHYAAMSKFTQSFKTLQLLLSAELGNQPEYSAFLKLFFEVGGLDDPQMRAPFDPRKTTGVLAEFEHLLHPREFAQIKKDFKVRLSNVQKEALNM